MMTRLKHYIILGLLVVPMLINAQINTNNHLLISKAYCQYGEYSKALSYLNTIDIKDTKSTDLLLIKAQCLYATKQIEEAANVFLNINQKNAKLANYELAQCYAILNKESFALKHLELYLNTKDKKQMSSIKSDEAFDNIKESKAWVDFWKKDWYNKSELRYADANYEYRHKNYDESMQILDEILEKRKSMHQAYWLKAMCFKESGDVENALYQITQASKIKPRNAQYHYIKASYEYELNKISKAKKSLNNAFAQDSTQIDYYTLQAQINLALKQEEQALETIEQINDLIDYEPVKYIAAQLFYEAKDYMSALKYINTCIKSSNSQIEYYKLRAQCYYQSGVYAFAEKDFSFLLDYEPQNGELYAMRGLCRQKQGNRKGACSDWHKARSYRFIEVDEYLEKYCY